MNFQPPDPADEGYCPRCKTFIHRDELLQDGCIECDDLLIADMKALWAGRKRNAYYPFNYVVAVLGKRTTRVFGPPNYYRPIDWRGLI